MVCQATPTRPLPLHVAPPPQNFFRWLEYSLSAAVMHVMIAQLAGVTEIHLLFTIFGLSSATMAYGLLMERQNGRRIPTYTLGDSLGDEPTCDNDRCGLKCGYIRIHRC